MRYRTIAFLAVLLTPLLLVSLAAQEKLTLQKGDHVTVIGNGLPERMNHFGYFETLLQARHPNKNLVVRNIGYGGDVVDENKNLRADGYPGRDEWLSMLDTDVLLVMYGFNESFRGPEHADDFRNQMSSFVKHVRNTKYNGESPPRVVLFSPIAFEDLEDPNLPDGSKQNRNLKRYTSAMASVAEAHDVPFVDLFTPTKNLFESTDRNLTFNGVHLTRSGYKQLAQILDQRLLNASDEVSWNEHVELRRAVNQKNEYWFDRYRVNDKNDIYGTRSDLTYKPNNTSNLEVLQHELTILDQMVKNRDRKVWAAAQGKAYTVTDDNLPEHKTVETNAPGDGPGGSHTFLDGEEAIKKMDLHKNMSINLFASEEQFPSLVNPVQIKFDTKGRLWVAAWEGYPTYKPPGPKRDKLVILEDTNDDGVADNRTIFADHLKDPTGFHFWNDGVIVTQPPYVMFLKDTDGDGKADLKRRLLSHVSAADTHSAMSNYVWDQGGKLFMSEGYILDSQIETPYGPVRNKDSAIWSFDPDTFRVRRYVSYDFANAHGHDVNRWNQGFLNDATPAASYHDTLISGYLPYPKQHDGGAPLLYDPRVRPASAIRIFSSGHFPERFLGNLMIANVISVQGFQLYNIQRDGASYQGNEKEPIVTSEDPNFRPADMAFGPRGALYLADWHNPLIGHMQHHIRDPSRDHEHGRIYRVTYDKNELTEPKQIDGQPSPHLLSLLKSRFKHLRKRAKIELDERDPEKVMTATEQWLSNLDPEEPGYEHHVLDGLWLHQWFHTVDADLLERVLNFDDPRARAAAVRVLSYWHEDVEDAEQLAEQAVNDPDPLVRLEAVRALSFFKHGTAAGIALQVLNHNMDQYLKYTLNETIRALAPHWETALRSGKPIIDDNTDGLKYLLDRIENSDTVRQILLEQPSSPAVNRLILQQPNIPLARRRKALHQLAKKQGNEPVDLLLEHIGKGSDTASSTLVPLLEQMDREQLAPRADELERAARETPSPGLRTSAFIALATIDGNVDRITSIASGSPARTASALQAIKQIQNDDVRRSAYDFVKSVIFNPPGNKTDAPIQVEYYSSRTDDAQRSSYDNRTPTQTRYTNRISTDLARIRKHGTGFALRFETSIRIDRAGTYTFHLTSDDGSRLYVNGKQIINNDGSHPPKEKSGSVQLASGTHNLTLTHFDSGGSYSLSLAWTPPGTKKKQSIPSDVFVRQVRELVGDAIHTLSRLPVPARQRLNDLVNAMLKTEGVLSAAGEIRRLGRSIDRVPSGIAEKAATGILSFAETLSPDRRAKPDIRRIVSFARNLTQFVDGNAGARLKRALRRVQVRIIPIKTVPGQMKYDTTSITASPGETIAIKLVNTDKMPHNMVITKPGAYKRVGKASMDQKNGAKHDYIPTGKNIRNQILWHTSLLDPDEREQIVFEVPSRPDDYPYLCTFPGHWRTMKGVMHVKESDTN